MICQVCNIVPVYRKASVKVGAAPKYCMTCKQEMLRTKAREYQRAKKGYIRKRSEESAAGEMGLPKRFWDKVNKTSSCWLWTAGHIRGYGVYSLARGKSRKAHRVSYEAARGSIGEGLVIDHLCRQTLCVNPEHLEAVSPMQNCMRGNTLAAANVIKTVCQKGHPFTTGNTIVRVSKKTQRCERICRQCSLANYKAYRLRKKIIGAAQMG